MGIFNAGAPWHQRPSQNNVFALADAAKMLAHFKRVGGPVGPVSDGTSWRHGRPVNDGCRLDEHHPAQRPTRESMETYDLLTYPIIFSEHMPQPNYDDVLLADFNAYRLQQVRGRLQIILRHYAFVTRRGHVLR